MTSPLSNPSLSSAAFPGGAPTPSQAEAMGLLEAFLAGDVPLFRLTGPAGTGKTHLIRALCHRLETMSRTFTLLAPTGRAARVLGAKTGCPASTLHRRIYQTTRLREIAEEHDREVHRGAETFKFYFEVAANQDSADHVYIVDEASMLSDMYQEPEFIRFGSGYLLRDLLHFVNPDPRALRRKIIFVGDPFQLPPVGSNHTPALDGKYLLRNFDLPSAAAELRDVVRQGGESGILRHAGTLRAALSEKSFALLDLGPIGEDVRLAGAENVVAARGDGQDVILVAYSNARVAQHNRLFREHFHPGKADPQPGEPMMVVHNHYQGPVPLMNGDIVELVEADSRVEEHVVFLNKPDQEGKRVNVRVPLRFRKVALRVTRDDGTRVVVENLVSEDLLLSPTPDLDSDQTKGLYILFKLRHTDLKPNTEAFREALREDPYFNCVRLKYAYAATCHKAQGGEWNRVLVDFDGRKELNEDCFRWIYTAITRAQRELFLLDPPRVTRLVPARPVAAPPPAVSVAAGPDMETWLRERISERVSLTDLRLDGMVSHPYALVVMVSRGADTANSRISWNGKGLVTTVQGIGRGNAELDRVLSETLSPLRGQGPATQAAATESFAGTRDQSAFYNDLRAVAEASALPSPSAEVLSPYHLRLRFQRGNANATINAYFNGKGRLRSVEPHPSGNDAELLREALTLFQKPEEVIP